MNVSRSIIKSLEILGVIALAFVFAVAQVTPAFAQSGTYPLAGSTYHAQNFSGASLPAYDSVWTSDGRLWEPTLPPGPQRVAHAVSVEIMPGDYVANGVSCAGYLDETRNGKGSSNKQVFAYENGKNFSVRTSDGKAAWMLIECDGGPSSGYDIWAVNPTYSGTAVSQPGSEQSDYDAPTYQPTPSNFLPFGFDWLSLIAMLMVLGCGGVITLGILIGATISAWKHGATWGLLMLFVGGGLMLFLPILGHLIVIIAWIVAATTPIAVKVVVAQPIVPTPPQD